MKVVILAAGKSSRFGGEPKMLSKVGPNNESLFEITLQQVSKHFNINHIYLVLGPHNEEQIRTAIDKMKINCLNHCDFTVTVQTEARGTAHALNTLSNIIVQPFLLMNSDDLYGEETFELLSKEITETSSFVIGYPIGKTLQSSAPANRAFIQHDKNNKVTKLQEKLNLRRSFYSPQELDSIIVSVNLFYLQPHIMPYIRTMVREKYMENEDEIMLPNIINDLITSGHLNLEFLSSPGQWQGVTYKEDVKSVKQSLKASYKQKYNL